MKLFLSTKYHADNANRPQIGGITAALSQRGWEVIFVVRDIEGWGERPFASKLSGNIHRPTRPSQATSAQVLTILAQAQRPASGGQPA